MHALIKSFSVRSCRAASYSMAFLTPAPLRVAAGQQPVRRCSSSLFDCTPCAVLRKGAFSGKVFNDGNLNTSQSPPPESSSAQPPPSSSSASSSPSPSARASVAVAENPVAVSDEDSPFSRTALRETNAYADFLPPLSQDPVSSLLRLATTPLTQSLFETPPVAFLYERGWRRQFKTAGFPGPAAEASLALDHVGRTGTLLDVSCATGVLTRELASAGSFDAVYGLDVSAEMLKEASQRDAKGQFRRVRADVADMPFADGSFDAVVSGAALHCWPSVQDGLAEVRRVLKEGSSFFATTFLVGAYNPIGTRAQRSGVFNRGTPYRFFEAKELYWLCKAAGFESVEVEEIRGCAVVRCVK